MPQRRSPPFCDRAIILWTWGRLITRATFLSTSAATISVVGFGSAWRGEVALRETVLPARLLAFTCRAQSSFCPALARGRPDSMGPDHQSRAHRAPPQLLKPLVDAGRIVKASLSGLLCSAAATLLQLDGSGGRGGCTLVPKIMRVQVEAKFTKGRTPRHRHIQRPSSRI